ncbi:uncharacterized protein KY384_002150 [Bacidia gigantensis]|uniref:uncharacterized protein n=1 Tax=Bacidia gigantensis TaxID=2732470 RepID=UPI001D04870E|nr:uncharacterized protein KY384_002150 [Bacidia gigantensis]KAG8533367.1 hypothetical protein KY384_002150 [Bacidia gigantensis]
MDPAIISTFQRLLQESGKLAVTFFILPASTTLPFMNTQQQHGSPYFSGPVQAPPPLDDQNNKRKGDDNENPTPNRDPNETDTSVSLGELSLIPIYVTYADDCRVCPAMNVKDEKSNATARTHVKDAETCRWNASMPPIAAAPPSRIRSRSIVIYTSLSHLLNGSAREFKDMSDQIEALRQQVNNIYGLYHDLRNTLSSYPVQTPLNQVEPAAAYRSTLSPSQSRASHPQFQGPTSAAFNLDVAKSSLQTMGITQPEIQDDSTTGDIDPALGLESHQQQAPVAAMINSPHKDPLWQLSKDDAIRLCRIYDEEIGMMYPMLDINQIILEADMVFDFIESARRTNLMQSDLPGADRLEGSDINILRMVLASGLMAEGRGESTRGRAIFESCQAAYQNILSVSAVDIKGLILLVILAEYHFQVDEEVQAYRWIGVACRLCNEMGINRSKRLIELFPDDTQRQWAVRLFWSIFVLDRRWSIGAGMPFSMQDADIDHDFPEPDDSTPYLTAMIAYSRIAAKVQRTTPNLDSGPLDIDRDNINYLDYEVLKWHRNIPESLRFDPSSKSYQPPSGVTRGQQRLHIILYFRTNQLRTLIYRPVLRSATTIVENRQFAQTGVDVAKETVQVLTRLNETTDIYSTQQVCFNYFLASAIAVLFLAVCHAPVEFSHQVRDEFYLAVDLVRGFSNNSLVAQNIWKMISSLKAYAPKLGLISRQAQSTTPNDAHSTAALGLADLAGQQVDQAAAYASAGHTSGTANASSSINGQQMSNELMNLFEAAKGYGNAPTSGAQGMEGSAPNAYAMPLGDRSQATEGLGAMYGTQGELSKIMKDLF